VIWIEITKRLKKSNRLSIGHDGTHFEVPNFIDAAHGVDSVMPRMVVQIYFGVMIEEKKRRNFR
jgi:hypothetical protein